MPDDRRLSRGANWAQIISLPIALIALGWAVYTFVFPLSAGGSAPTDTGPASEPVPTAQEPGHSPVRVAGDLSVRLIDQALCFLRSGNDGRWDVNVMFSVVWTGDGPVPPSTLQVTTDTGRTRDWHFSPPPVPAGRVALGQPGSYVDTYVDQDERYLGRSFRLTVTIDPANTLTEPAEGNNTAHVVVHIPEIAPPPDASVTVKCR